jgi:hypothetical protein
LIKKIEINVTIKQKAVTQNVPDTKNASIMRKEKGEMQENRE